VEGCPEPDGSVGGGNISRVDGEAGGGVAEDGGLEFPTEVVGGREGEDKQRRLILAHMPDSMMSVLENIGGRRRTSRNETESKGASARSMARRRNLRDTVEEFNRLEGNNHRLEIRIRTDVNADGLVQEDGDGEEAVTRRRSAFRKDALRSGGRLEEGIHSKEL
jgi:hypothetical protein